MTARSNDLSPQAKDDLSSGVASADASPLSTEADPPTVAQLERARLEDGWRADLARLEYEIETLRSVLIVKNNQAADLKRRLGITPIAEIKQDLQQGLKTIKESEAYQKTGSALKNFGDFASRKLTDLRNSNAFKSVEDKVGGAYQSVKMRTSSTKSDDGFEDTMSASASVVTTPSSDDPIKHHQDEKTAPTM